MMFFWVLVEGDADEPVVEEIMARRFGLAKDRQFRVIPHQGKGRLPRNPLHRPDVRRRGLLDQLPAKLRGMSYQPDCWVVVLVDADEDDCIMLKARLVEMLNSLDRRPPHVLIRIAVEETESWFVADPNAVQSAYPRCNVRHLRRIAPDEVCGAWERLAEAVGERPADCRGPDKYRWAAKIAPELDLDAPNSPSLKAFVDGIDRCLQHSETEG
jgi:hypothetical protein